MPLYDTLESLVRDFIKLKEAFDILNRQEVWKPGTKLDRWKKYTNSGVTTSGQVTFYLTNDGLVGGKALFLTILSITAIGVRNTVDPKEFLACSIKTLSGVTLIVNCGDAQESDAPDGTVVYLEVMGE